MSTSTAHARPNHVIIILAMLASAAVMPPAVGQVTLVSTTWNGAPATSDSETTAGVALSADGRYAAFASSASNLVAGDTNGWRDVFVRDLVAGTTQIMSVDTNGVQGNADSGGWILGIGGKGVSISPDGRFVTFVSFADNLVAGDGTTLVTDIFVRDRDVSGNGIFDQPGDVSTTRVSIDSQGNEADNLCYSPVISADGRYVAFASLATNLVAGDNNGRVDIFVHDRQGATTTRVNIDAMGNEADLHSNSPSISSDGRYILFSSDATNLVPNDLNGASDVFRYDQQTGTLVRLSVDSSGTEANGGSFSASGSISADGRHIAFVSFATNLVPNDTNTSSDVFVHDTQSGATVRSSVTTAGAQGGDDCWDAAISADGRRLAFTTWAANYGDLPVFGLRVIAHDRDVDGDGVFDETGAIASRVSANIGSPMPSSGALSISGLGGRAAVSTSLAMLPADTNVHQDVYVVDLPIDSDGDGFLDSEETGGVDGDGDGTPDLFLTGANPNRKDIYVEIDGYAGRVPSLATLNAVVSAFANAPVSNPDGSTGITLHLNIDETAIPLVQWWTMLNAGAGTTPWSDFANEKNARFGTPGERAAGNWPAMRSAKIRSYHYCFFANQFPAVIGTQIVNTVSGMGELRGNDFFLSLGAWTPAGGTAQQIQGVFMHELGHNLGLEHGGGDTINYKPNYRSGMSYNWTVPAVSGLFSQIWFLDYSRSALPTLIENCLNEPAGIGGNPGLLTPVGPPANYRLVWEGGPVDWNGDTVSTHPCAWSNINQVPANPNSPAGQALVGFDDWNSLVFYDPSSGNWANAVHGAVNPLGEELRYEQVQTLTHLGDCDGNGILDTDDIIMGNGEDCDLDGLMDACLPAVPWYEDFESYDPQGGVHGSRAWSGWDDDPAFDAPVTDLTEFDRPRSAYNTLEVDDDVDIVRQFCHVEDDEVWSFSAWQYIPSDFVSGGAGTTTGSYFMLLNTYASGGPYHWSVQIGVDSTINALKVWNGNGDNTINVPYVEDRWVKIQTIIDLEDDWTRVYYDDELVTEYSWTGGVIGDGGGALDIAAVDLFGNGSSPVYYDDLKLSRAGVCGGLADDFDTDGLTTEQELLRELDPCNPDSDGDGTLDGVDNCDGLYNPLQFDSDSDTVGDACETCHGFDDLEDCNDNALPDACDVLEGVSADENGNLIPDECEGLGCHSVEECADQNGDGIRDDGCVHWNCEGEDCVATGIVFAEMGGQFGACTPDGASDGNDRFHALNCFANVGPDQTPGYQCEANPPAAFNVDAGGPFGDCNPDGVCDGNDAFHALNAFGDATPCGCPLDGGPAPVFNPVVVDHARLLLGVERGAIHANDIVTVTVSLDNRLEDLRGYQLHLGVSGGERGRLEVIDIEVAPSAQLRTQGARRTGMDHDLSFVSEWTAFNVDTAQMVAGRDSEGVVARPGVLATFTLQASSEAAGTFTIELRHDDDDPDARTFLFPTPAQGRIAIHAIKPVSIVVEP